MKNYFVSYVCTLTIGEDAGKTVYLNTSLNHEGIKSLNDVRQLEERIKSTSIAGTEITIINWTPFEK